MPKAVSCKVCGHKVSGVDFAERMGKLRTHYRDKHPKEFKGWEHLKPRVRKHDPEALKRKDVKAFKDYPTKGVIRLLELEDGTYFPEYALYDAKRAGLKEDFIHRNKDYNLFVYK